MNGRESACVGEAVFLAREVGRCQQMLWGFIAFHEQSGFCSRASVKGGRRSPGWVKKVVLVMWWESQRGVGTIWIDDKGPLTMLPTELLSLPLRSSLCPCYFQEVTFPHQERCHSLSLHTFILLEGRDLTEKDISREVG